MSHRLCNFSVYDGYSWTHVLPKRIYIGTIWSTISSNYLTDMVDDSEYVNLMGHSLDLMCIRYISRCMSKSPMWKWAKCFNACDFVIEHPDKVRLWRIVDPDFFVEHRLHRKNFRRKNRLRIFLLLPTLFYCSLNARTASTATKSIAMHFTTAPTDWNIPSNFARLDCTSTPNLPPVTGRKMLIAVSWLDRCYYGIILRFWRRRRWRYRTYISRGGRQEVCW